MLNYVLLAVEIRKPQFTNEADLLNVGSLLITQKDKIRVSPSVSP